MGGRCLEATTTRRVIVCLRVCIVRLRRAPVALWRAPCLASPPHDAPARRVGHGIGSRKPESRAEGGLSSCHIMPCHVMPVAYCTQPIATYETSQPAM